MDSNSSLMTCLVFSSSFVGSDNFSIIVSLNDLQSNSSTLLQLSVEVAATPSNSQPGNHVDWQEVTTIAVAAGIVVRLVCSVFNVALNVPQVLCVAIGCCYFIARRRSDMKVPTQLFSQSNRYCGQPDNVVLGLAICSV